MHYISFEKICEALFVNDRI